MHFFVVAIYFYCKEKAQLTFTASKSTIELLEKGVKYVQN